MEATKESGLENPIELVHKLIHDIRGSVTVLQLFMNSWESGLTASQKEDYPTMMKEIEKIKANLNALSQTTR
jgi:hypothetical protein